jgi:hypothetical protein
VLMLEREREEKKGEREREIYEQIQERDVE